jgi:predicted transcriptional regulator
MVTVSFPCSAALKRDLSAIAQKDSRTLSAWLRLKLQETVRRSRAAKAGAPV